MKKIIILLIICFSLCGCSSEVNINIDKDTVTEVYNIMGNNQEEYNQMKNTEVFPLTLYIDEETSNPWGNERESGVSYYKTEYNDFNRTLTVKGTFALSEHNRSNIINQCFRYYDIRSDETSTVFSTSEGITCKYNNFKLNIKTPYLVMTNNAHSIDKTTNTYTWNVNDANTNNINIYLEVDFSKKFDGNNNESDNTAIEDFNQNNETNDNESSNSLIWLYIGIIGFASVVVIVFILIRKNKMQSSI